MRELIGSRNNKSKNKLKEIDVALRSTYICDGKQFQRETLALDFIS
jgi:hypothetical protein